MGHRTPALPSHAYLRREHALELGLDVLPERLLLVHLVVVVKGEVEPAAQGGARSGAYSPPQSPCVGGVHHL